MRPRHLTVPHRKKRNPNCGFDLMNRRRGETRSLAAAPPLQG
jgi:hypothetical protein